MNTHYEPTRDAFKTLVTEAYTSEDISPIEKGWTKVDANDADKRNILDVVLKDFVLELSASPPAVQQLVSFSVALSKADLCSASTPIVLLSDIFDIYTISECETLFAFVEKNVSVWKDDMFYASCKNNLLRMCNDLLRRLSRSQNTVFRGRILLFLASFFPFSERSGLNLVSEVNLESANEYKKEEDTEPEPMETDDGDESVTLRVDYNLYNKFLTLQDFMRNPALCYVKLSWAAFVLSWTDFFQAFQNMKLDKVSHSRKSAREHLADSEEGSVFFAKYLNNPRLLQLQLSDPNFRRSLIIQGLITLQYLSSSVKSKLDKYELRTMQQDWVRDQETFLYNLLAETPRGSERFRDIVRHMLAREQLWNNWKNEGCQEFTKPGGAEEGEERKPRAARRRPLGDIIKNATNNGRYYMGNPEMTRLWNLNPSNLEACKAEERSFLPSLEQYMADAITQLDPAAGIEPEFKRVNDPNFGWRALRLLAQRSTCFFAQNGNTKPITKLPDFIETSLKSVLKVQPSVGGEEIDIKMENEEEGKDMAMPSGTREDTKMTDEAIEGVAERLGEDWLKLAAKLGYKDSNTALEMLRTWVVEDEDSTADNLAYMLEGLKLFDAAEYLKTKFCKVEPEPEAETID